MSDGVEHVPGWCGGRAVLVGTRIPVWCLLRIAPKLLLEMYPQLTEVQVQAGLAYAEQHQEELARDLADNEGPDADELVCFISAYKSMRGRFGDEYESRFKACDELVAQHDEARKHAGHVDYDPTCTLCASPKAR